MDIVIICFQCVLLYTAEKVKIEAHMYHLIMKIAIRNSRNML